MKILTRMSPEISLLSPPEISIETSQALSIIEAGIPPEIFENLIWVSPKNTSRILPENLSEHFCRDISRNYFENIF